MPVLFFFLAKCVKCKITMVLAAKKYYVVLYTFTRKYQLGGYCLVPPGRPVDPKPQG